jgi:glycosyltransferase involved in cell wall biosynthesis
MIKEGGLRTRNIRKSTFAANNPLVSIITIIFNGEKHIEHTIQSVLQQTYPNIEYIIVDGGSTDDTLSILKTYEDQIDYWVSEQDKGISDAFNKGIQYATGEIIGIINADDWYQPDAIATIVHNFGSNDILYGKIKYWREKKIDKVSSANHHLLTQEMSLNHPAVFVRRTAFERWGLFDLTCKYAMDYDLLLRFYLQGAKFQYLDQVLANMRWGGFSDNSWFNAVKEVHRIKLKNKLPRLSSFLFTIKIFCFILASKLLHTLGVRPAYLKLKESIKIKKVGKIYEKN